MDKTGVLLINLGTPDEPTVDAVARYLKEFLMDPYTIDIPFVFRWILVNMIITPRRSPHSAHAYQQIWTQEGSPLRVQTGLQGKHLQKKLDQSNPQKFIVKTAMRYGKPSVHSELADLQKMGIKNLIVFPLYPQYAGATTQTAIDKVIKEMVHLNFFLPTQFIPSFYSDIGFHQLTATMYKKSLPRLSDYHLLFSFHGLPVRQLKKLDFSKKHCYVKNNCCETINEANQFCYKAQSLVSAKGIAKCLDLKQDSYSVCFQSRLGSAEWIQPYSDEHVTRLAKSGVTKLAVSSLSFVTDCLENLEEVGVQLKETFFKAGGKEFILLPSYNTEPLWIEFLAKKVLQAKS